MPAAGEETQLKAVRVVIAGRVQGVWFRGWTVSEASRLGLDGWVRNRHDGTVEALFSGSASAVERMVAACWEGPPGAYVRDVRVAPAAPPSEGGFVQLPTV